MAEEVVNLSCSVSFLIEQSAKKLSKSNPSMMQDFFTYLPAEIITNILSRLPVRTIMSSKCVCKSWLQLLETDEFVHSHLAISVPRLAVLTAERGSSSCRVFEFEDRLDLEEHDLHYNPLFKFDFPHPVIIQGSANGLLLLYRLESGIHIEDELFVCNPITRDYIKLHCPEGFGSWYPQVATFGFGASISTGQLKVVRIFNDSINAKYECHINLGTESWRSIEPGSPFNYEGLIFGAFLNGNLYWIVSDSNGIAWISCFDLETEHFSSFSAPPLGCSEFLGGLSALGDDLCLCDNTIDEVIVIWLMKEHGVDKSWTKQYVMSENPEFYGESFEHIYAIKIFGDGDILMLFDARFLFYYSSKTKTTEEMSIFEPNHGNSFLLTPSFLSLRSFGIDGVVSL